MDSYTTNSWPFMKKPQILRHDDGYFIFRFDTIEDYETVMEASPYYFHNKPFVLQNWDINFEFGPDCIITIPLWVTFPGLPIGYWSPYTLSKVASAVGRPLYTDKFTAAMNRISYPRVLVETDVAHPLPNIIELLTPTGPFQQQVDYDWKPKYCSECLKFGPVATDCWNVERQAHNEQEFHGVKKNRRRRNRKTHQQPEKDWKAKGVVEQKNAETVGNTEANDGPKPAGPEQEIAQ
ncbi:uncharacterized protein LOC132643943 [Lycium barbarum]|uniref:uncharacterized protein LOC132643943 n=1 Tax=Lycium barbarum TaxID=112863 RepID=UPI00293EA25D|nr:uncharacterized protein LOC132643943 [Lycium barbarum]